MNFEDNPKVTAGLAIWMFVLFSAWTSYWSWDAIHISTVAERQQVGQAKVMSLGSWNHGQTYDYTFHVGNVNYSGNSVGPDENTYRKGQLVDVYFDPRDPKTSSLQTFSWSIVPNGLPIGFGVGAMIVAIIRWRRARVAIAHRSTGAIPH